MTNGQAKKKLAEWIEDFSTYLQNNRPAIFSSLEHVRLKKIVEKKPTPILLTNIGNSKPAAAKKEKIEPKKIVDAAPLPKQILKPPIDTFADVKATAIKHKLFSILENTACDKRAKERQEAYLFASCWTTFTIIHGNESPEKKVFLEDMASAITLHIGSAKVSTYTPHWQLATLFASHVCKAFIIEKNSLFSCPQLLEYYREIPGTNECFLQDTRVIVLDELSSYFKNHAKKRALWSDLQTILFSLL